MELTEEQLEQYRLAFEQASIKWREASAAERKAHEIASQCRKEMAAKWDAYGWAKLGMVQPEVKA